MNRRDFLRANSSICAGWALSRAVPVLADTPSAGEWRTFEIVTKVELLKPEGVSHIWLPAPLIRNTPYQNTISTRFKAEGGTARLSKDKQSAFGIVPAMYAANAKSTLSLTARIALKNYAVDLSSGATAPSASRTEMDYFLRPSRYVPTDGIVKQIALKATAGAKTDIKKARAIYEWVVENTFRDPKVRGCGRGDIRFMLESGDMGGKCADLNALYFGLARSVGLPARHVYGLRIAKSELGCIVMEYIDGASLKEAIPKGIDPGDAIRLANELKLSEHTVRNYLFHIFDKLGVSSRIELALYAVSCTKGKPASGVQDDQLERNSAGSAELAGELFLLADPGSGAESPLRRKNSPRGRLQLT